MKKIKHLKFVKKVIDCPAGYDTLREHGNIYEHNGQFIFPTTCVRTISGKKEYSTHYWTASNKENWSYRGKLNLPFESEDFHLSRDNNGWVGMYENKSSEKNGRFIISYATASDLSSTWGHWGGSYGYEPSKTGIEGCLAVYSPIRTDSLRLISDWRTMAEKPHQENIGLALWKGNTWGTMQTIMYADDYGYSSLGVGGSLHNDNGYVLELAGLLDFDKPTQRWVNGLATCSSLTGDWKILNKELKDNNGNNVWATFANDGKWFALAGKDMGSKEIYLAELVTDGTQPPKPPPSDNEALVADIRKDLLSIDIKLGKIK